MMSRSESVHRLCIYCRTVETSSEPCQYAQGLPQTVVSKAVDADIPASGLLPEDAELIKRLQAKPSALCERCSRHNFLKALKDSRPLDPIQRRSARAHNEEFEFAQYRIRLDQPSSLVLSPSCPYCRVLYCILPRCHAPGQYDGGGTKAARVPHTGEPDLYLEPCRSYLRTYGWEALAEDEKEEHVVMLGLFTSVINSVLVGDPAFQRGPRSTGPTISMASGPAPLGRALYGLQQPIKSTPNLSMLSLPLNYCISNHGSHCHIDQPEELYTTRMLDFFDRKVVPCPRNCDYIALSYVWEGVHPLPGALENRCLPQTIEDAITVTKALGRRYLWVDALCIDQSPNPTEAQKREKIKQLDMMSSIYGCATVTIVALVGKHADAGLPGISTPRLTQVKENIDDCTIFTGPQHLTLEQEAATYSSRAWTYQEELLSRRVLTFTQSLVAFRCRVFDVDESMDTKTLKNSPVRDINSPSIADQPMPKADPQKRMYYFSGQLQAYTSRRMTNEGDSLNAFRGVLSLLGDDLFPEGFVHGLPLRSHAFSLGWMHSRDAKPKRRLEFPSWSWTGWEGTAMYSEKLIDTTGQEHPSNTTKDLELVYLGCDNNYIDVGGWCVDIDIRTEPLSELFAPGQDESIGTVKEGDHKHNNTLKTGSYHCLIIQRVSERIKGRDMQRETVYLLALEEVGQVMYRKTLLVVNLFYGQTFDHITRKKRRIRLA